MKKIVFVLPAYNEGKSLPSLLKRFSDFKLEHFEIELVIINDGSTDDTEEIAESYRHFPVQLLNIEPNKGLANALLAGIKKGLAITTDGDILVTMDADNSHDPNYVKSFVEKIEKGASIVIASRYQRLSKIKGLSNYRKYMSIGAFLLFKLLKPIPNVRDYTCGFRGYKRSILQQGLEHYGSRLIEQTGFSCMAELLLKLVKLKPNPIVSEIPFILEYNLKKSTSKMNVLKTIGQTIGLLFSPINTNEEHKRT